MNTKELNVDCSELECQKPKKNPSKFKLWLEDTIDDIKWEWHNLTYKCWRRPKMVIHNFWVFRKEIANFRDYDYEYNFSLFNKSLELTANGIDDREVITDHKETADQIRKVIKLYEKICEDNYYQEIEGSNDTIEDKRENYKIAEQNKQKDIKKYLEELSKFETWWD